jgi:hypothetical protein
VSPQGDAAGLVQMGLSVSPLEVPTTDEVRRNQIARAGQLAEALRKAGSANSDIFGRIGDKASVNLMQNAKRFADELVHAAETVQRNDTHGTVGNVNILLDKLKLAKPEHERLGADVKFVPVMTFIDAKQAHVMQTCSGDAVGKPIIGVSENGCASACDAKAGLCAGYSHYGSGQSSLCFLFAKFNSVTYYPECNADTERFLQQKGEQKTVKVAKWECGSEAQPLQSTTTDSGITRIESLHIGTGTYELVMEIPKTRTVPAFRSINSCAINPKDEILHCSMEINNKGSFLVRIDSTQVAFVTKLPGWRYSAVFDADGNYYIYGNSGLSMIPKVTDEPSYSDLDELQAKSPHSKFTPPKAFEMGADLVVLRKDLEGTGVQTYLLSLQNSDLHIVQVSTSPWKHWTLPCAGVPQYPLTWGSAWNFAGKYYFAPDTGEGVHELYIKSIDLKSQAQVQLKRVSDAQKTDWNDGFNCKQGNDPFDPNHIKQWDCTKQPRALQVTTTHLTVPTNANSKSNIEFLNIEEGKYEMLFEVKKSWTDPPFNCINSCAINPKDDVIHCTMEIDNRGSFLVRIDDSQVGYVAKVPGWQYAGIFDSKGNYYMYGNSGVSVVTGVADMPTKQSYLELSNSQQYSGPHSTQLGADLTVLEMDLEGTGKEETYLLALQSSNLHVLRVSTSPYKNWVIQGKGLPETATTWGSAWNFDGGIFFAPDSAEGVFQLLTKTVSLTQKVATFVKVGKSQETSWNDGFSCSKNIAPFTISTLQQTEPRLEAVPANASAHMLSPGRVQRVQNKVQCMAKISMFQSSKLEHAKPIAAVSRADGCL